MAMDELKPRDRRFVELYLTNGNNATRAAKEAYGFESDNVAAVTGHTKLSRDKIKAAIWSIAEAIPDDLLAEKHLALLNKTDDGDIDVAAVAKGLEMAYKIKGLYKSEGATLNIGKLEAVLVKFIDGKDDRDTDRVPENI